MIEMGKVVAVGTFDGLHPGHRMVIEEVRRIASENSLIPMVITFDRHPLEIIDPSRVPPLLTSIEEKKGLINDFGIDTLVLPFDEELRSTTALEWLRLLKEKYDAAHLVVGYDNTFGSDGVNLSIADYISLGKEIGISVSEAPVYQGVSSSAARHAVARGDIKDVHRLLGRPFTRKGIVVEGNKLGRTIGFPTANLEIEPGLAIPAPGVYAAAAFIEGDETDVMGKNGEGGIFPAMVNIGCRPTVSNSEKLSIEAHIIGWEGDLYFKPLILQFLSRLRDETDFKDIALLKNQLEKDKEAALEAYNSVFKPAL